MVDHRDTRRKSMRAKHYNYNQDGYYFITTVTNNRAQLLGKVEGGSVILSPGGKEVERCWLELENKCPQVRIEDYVIMPNHIHGVIRILPKDMLNLFPETLGDLMRWFKTMSTNAYIRGVNEHDWPRFYGRLWQPQFWDHIIRDDNDLVRVQEYITANPYQWEMDPDNAESDEAW